MSDLIRRFRDYQIEWLTAHNDIEFCEEEEKLIIRFLKDTAESFMRENQSAKMDDLISRQTAIDALKGLEFCQYMEFGEYIGEDTKEVRLIRAEKAQDALQKLPSAEKTGKWENNQNGTFTCSECGCKHSRSNYCPNCGADMREVEE